MSVVGVVATATLTFTGCSLLAFAAAVYDRQDGPGVAPFAAYVGLLGIAGTGGGVLATLASADATLLWFVRWAEVAAIAWIVFALAYTGRDEALTRRLIGGVVVLYLLLVSPLVADAIVVDVPLAVESVLRISTDLFGVVLTLLGATLVFETTYRHGVKTPWIGVTLGAAGFLPWFVTLSGGFALRSTPGDVLLSLFAAGFLASGILMAVAVYSLEAFDGAAATHTHGRRAILSGAEDLVIVVDASERIVESNASARRRLQIDGTAADGADLASVVGTDVDGLDRTRSVELATIDGLRQFDADVTELSDRRDRPLGHLVSLRDITHRRQREQGLEVLNRLLRHNLRNALNVVEVRTSLVADQVDDPSLSEHLAEANRSVADLVAISEKVEAIDRAIGRRQLRLTDVDVGDLVASVAASAREDYPSAEIVVTGGDGTVVRTFEPLFHLALENLVENAVEHSEAETPRAVIACAGGGDGVTVTVDDNGPGIPDAEASVIREGRETPTEHASSVGLWLVNWAVTTCGGTVSFGDGRAGARVEVWLPDRDEGGGSVDRSSDG